MYGLIDIHVNSFVIDTCDGEETVWTVSQLSHHNGGQGDQDPEIYGDSSDHYSRDQAVSTAKSTQSDLIRRGVAGRVVIFVDGEVED